MSGVWQRFADAMRPLPDLSPDEFASKHRVLHASYCSERPGRWDASVFPHQGPLQNTVQEAFETGKKGVVWMKAGQGGGTDCAINAQLWAKVYYPGPQLFMASTDKMAKDFGRERHGPVIKDMPPLRAKYIPNARGDTTRKRFVDGKIELTGGQSVYNLQSTPYRVVVIDELDSLVENLQGDGDPVKLAEVRTDSFSGPTLIIAYAHPTTRGRGAAKLYYEQSDQRRGFVKHDCGGEFWLQWEHVICIGAETDPDAYVYKCPCCGAVVTDAERVAMCRKVVYRSTLPPEVAAKKAWIGCHFSQLYYPHKTIRSLAQRRIECGTDENAIRVFWNKVLGEPYEPKLQTFDLDQLRSLIVKQRRRGDLEYYSRGQVPPGVRFLTAGQDSRTKELHYSIWGWGLRRGIDKTTAICGWLIDWGTIDRPYSLTFAESEYHVFDDLIYRAKFTSTDGKRRYSVLQCGHDIGYKPTQLPIIRYCRSHPKRAIPVKGAALTPTSFSDAPYAQWGRAIKHIAGETTAEDVAAKQLRLNTYLLKTDFYGYVGRGRWFEIPDILRGEAVGTRKVAQVTFPEDVDEEFLKQVQSEELSPGDRKDELVWTHKGPNHYADTVTYAFGLAQNLEFFSKGKTDDEARADANRPLPPPETSKRAARRDPAMG